MPIWLLLLIYIFIILLFLFIVNFKWCINTLRSIASPKNQSGYIKLIQMGIIFTLIAVFCGVLVYYIMNPCKVDRVDIILTVVVGWLGLIIGRFFGERAMEHLDEARQLNVEKLKSQLEKMILINRRNIDRSRNYMNKYIRKITELKKK